MDGHWPDRDDLLGQAQEAKLMNPYVILGSVVAWLASLAVTGWLMYARGHDDMRNAYTEQALGNANATIKGMQGKQAKSDEAGEKHDQNITRINVDTSAIARALSDMLANLPAGSDPLVPVWFVRMHDRAASRNLGADPYPGKSDGDASDVRLSQALAMLSGNYGKCELNSAQLSDLIAYLKADRAPEKRPSFLDRINPFQD